MDIFSLITERELTLLTLVVAASLGGSYFAIWRNGTSGSILSACLLLVISGTLAVTGEHTLIGETHPLVYAALMLGSVFGLTFPCCAPKAKLGTLQTVASAAVLMHCVLDGHMIREAGSGWLITLLLAHKFQDGADGRLLSRDNQAARMIGRIAIAAATPIGFLLVPESAVNPVLHGALFAGVIGLNLGSAFHLFKHAMHLRQERCATC